MNAASTLVALGRAGVVPVMRDRDAAAAVERGRGFAAGGLDILEVTFSVPDAAQAIRELARDGDLLVGAGTVLTEEQARAALAAGAGFLVSPVNPPFLLPLAREAGVPAIPGAATPQEIWQATRDGAEAVKVFPIARLGGADYVRDVLAPMPRLRLVATGGIGPADAPALLAAGCLAVGLGSALDDPSLGPTPAARAAAVRALVLPVRQLRR